MAGAIFASLPELVRPTLECVGADESGRRTLSVAAAVNHTWNLIAIPILWQRAPPTALAQLHPTRRQSYANHICYFTFSSSKLNGTSLHEAFATLNFPYLKDLGLYLFGEEMPPLKQYLQSNLRRLEICRKESSTRDHNDGERDDDHSFLNTMAKKCPNLQEFASRNCLRVTTFQLLQFLNSQKRLETVKVCFFYQPMTKSETALFGKLISSRELRTFSFMPGLTITCDTAIELISDPCLGPFFPNTESVSLNVSVGVSRMLLSSAGALRNLHLKTAREGAGPGELDDAEAFEVAGRFGTLHSLSLHVPLPVTTSCLLHLTHLTHLRRLEIKQRQRRLLPSDMDNASLSQLTSRLSRLESLILGYFCPRLTIDVLIVLGRNCPRLRKIYLMSGGDTNQSAIEDMPVNLLPSLHKLDFITDDITVPLLLSPDTKWPRNVAKELKLRFPKLSHYSLDLRHGETFGDIVIRRGLDHNYAVLVTRFLQLADECAAIEEKCKRKGL